MSKKKVYDEDDTIYVFEDNERCMRCKNKKELVEIDVGDYVNEVPIGRIYKTYEKCKDDICDKYSRKSPYNKNIKRYTKLSKIPNNIRKLI